MACLKTYLEETISSEVLPQLVLLGCKLCKLISENKFDKNSVTHQWINFIMLPVVELKNHMREDKKEYTTLSRLLSLYMFEEEQKRFQEENDVNERIKLFLELIKDRKVKEAYQNLSEYSFYELLKRLIMDDNYDLFAFVSFNFLFRKVMMVNATFRTRFYYKSCNESNPAADADNNPFLFFDIGYSLDEGMTQSSTIEIMNMLFNDMASGKIEKKTLVTSEELTDEMIEEQKIHMRQMYYLEVQFVKRILNVFPEKYKKSLRGKIAFENLGVPLIYQLANYSDNICDFYNLFDYTDEQDWENANAVLTNIIKKVNIDEVIDTLKI